MKAPFLCLPQDTVQYEADFDIELQVCILADADRDETYESGSEVNEGQGSMASWRRMNVPAISHK